MLSEVSKTMSSETVCKTSCENPYLGWNFSKRGYQSDYMFTGTMNAVWLGTILEAGLLPFIAENFSCDHRLFNDNDPKHLSYYIEDFLNATM